MINDCSLNFRLCVNTQRKTLNLCSTAFAEAIAQGVAR
jgi:hypothetical protein